jgi:hypothetical protein
VKRTWIQRFEASSAHTQASIVFSGVIMVATIAYSIIAGIQLYVMSQASKDSATQTNQLITAANINAAASQRNAAAAESFATAASNINKGVGAAVAKLNLQAGALQQSVEQATKLANETAKANEYVVTADRPWVGVESHAVDNFEEGKTAKITITYINTGKRPATASIVYGPKEFSYLPSDPISMANQQASVAFMLPGGHFTSAIDYPVEMGLINRLNREKKILFFVAEIIYTDVGTNKSYITHFCESWAPSSKTIPFPLCTRYNDAK